MPDLPLTTRYARATVVGWTVFVGGALAAATLMTLSGVAAGSVFHVPGLWVVGLPFMVAAVWFLRLLRRRFAIPGPVITISAAAYHDRRLGAPIPWSEMRSLLPYKPGNRMILLIDADRPERFLGNAGMLKGPMLSVNPRMGMPVLASRLDGLEVPQAVLAEAAEAAFAASR